MRQFARSHRAATSAVLGVVFGLILFGVGGFSLNPLNVGMAVVLGCVFGAAAFRASSSGDRSR